MKIKVCGLREPENIAEVARLGVDFIGFIFYEKSPRFVGSDWPGPAPGTVPAGVRRVGVFVDADIGSILAAIRRHRLDFVQLHGAEPPETCAAVRRHAGVIKAFGVTADFDFEATRPYAGICQYLLFDTRTAAHGGSGEKFDWTVLQRYAGDTPFFLSGGLEPGDGAALRSFRHHAAAAIDLNSRFEILPGVKDPHKLALFLNDYTPGCSLGF